jgi:hypothetical protein
MPFILVFAGSLQLLMKVIAQGHQRQAQVILNDTHLTQHSFYTRRIVFGKQQIIALQSILLYLLAF